MLEDKDLLHTPRAAMQRLTQFLGVPMPDLPSWDPQDVEATIQATWVPATGCVGAVVHSLCVGWGSPRAQPCPVCPLYPP